MLMKHALAVTGLLMASTLGAQAAAPPTMSGALQRSFASVAGFLVQSAELMPADNYGFRATEDTRTFAQEIGHVADSHYFFCARAKNEAMPQRQGLENVVTDKTALIAGLKESVDYCRGVYDSMTDSMLAGTFQSGQARGVRLAPLSNNVAHDNEHYGKIVTLLRMNKLVPPSSRRQ
jgi:hypothetical protein